MYGKIDVINLSNLIYQVLKPSATSNDKLIAFRSYQTRTSRVYLGGCLYMYYLYCTGGGPKKSLRSSLQPKQTNKLTFFNILFQLISWVRLQSYTFLWTTPRTYLNNFRFGCFTLNLFVLVLMEPSIMEDISETKEDNELDNLVKWLLCFFGLEYIYFTQIWLANVIKFPTHNTNY